MVSDLNLRWACSALVWSMSRLAMCLVATIMSMTCDGFSSRLRAQQQGSMVTSALRLGFALQAPDFENSEAVEHHAVFSVFLANLLADAFARNSAEPCAVFAARANFPDLTILISLKDGRDFDLNEPASRNTLAGCVRSIENILTATTFERAAFDAAVQKAAGRDTWWRIRDYSQLNEPRHTVLRMQIVGRAALAELYRSDIVVSALVDLHGKIEASKDDYDGFSAWLDRQRQSHRMGFYPANKGTADAERGLATLQSTPSIRPLPRRDKPYRDEIHVDVPVNVRGRPFILVWCAVEHGRVCAGDAIWGACEDGVEIASPSSPEAANARLFPRPWGINLLGIGSWIVIDSDDEVWLRRLRDCLAKRPAQESSDVEGASAEFVTWVETK